MVSMEEPMGSNMVADAKAGQRVRSISTESSVSSAVPMTKPWTKATDAKKKPTTLPNETVEYLKAWMMSPEHVAHPYPTEVEKAKIMAETGLELKQLTNWFVNNRKRFWKPRVEARLKDQELTIGKVDGNLVSSDENVSQVGLSGSSTSDESKRASKRRSSIMRRLSAPAEQGIVSTAAPAPLPTRVVIEDSSVSCVSDGVTSSDDDDETEAHDRANQSLSALPAQEVCTEETVDVHILRPTASAGRSVPDLADVTVLQNVPSERVLRTFESCALTYRYLDANKAQSRRDAEIVRMKKHYLSIYLLETEKTEDAAILMACSSQESVPSRKRKVDDVHTVPLTPRPKYRRRSVELWKEACQTAGHVYDQDLPSLEEATLLFGYSS